MRYTELIDSYVNGEMDEASRKKFEAELKVNRDLALEYNLEKDLSKSLEQEDMIDFRAKCIEAQEEVNLAEKKLVKIVHITRKYWYAAASVLLVGLIIGGMLLFNPGGYSPEKLFRMYYSSETLGPSRSGNVDMVEALRCFSKNDFQTAEKLFDEILANDPSNIAVKYYSGISNIEVKNYPKAIQMFDSIVYDGDNLYVDNAEWYLGLTYLAAQQVEQANVIFTKIAADNEHDYNAKAKDILEKIGKSDKNKKILNNLLILILPF
jgi:tetratricopeptide (TPR) repeat protein